MSISDPDLFNNYVLLHRWLFYISNRFIIDIKISYSLQNQIHFKYHHIYSRCKIPFQNHFSPQYLISISKSFFASISHFDFKIIFRLKISFRFQNHFSPQYLISISKSFSPQIPQNDSHKLEFQNLKFNQISNHQFQLDSASQ